MVSCFISRFILLVVGILYPAYASHKAVKTKNVKEYVRWMIYWIVFAVFTLVEIFADIFIAFWFPFYYEFKIVLILWLTCPATKGSSFIYKKFVNPQLSNYEKTLDSYIESIWDYGYEVIRRVGTQAIDYIIQVVFELLQKGQMKVATLLPKITDIAQQQTVIQDPCNVNSSNEVVPVPAVCDDDVYDVPFEVLGESAENLKNFPAMQISGPNSEESAETDSQSEGPSYSVKSRPLVLDKKKKYKEKLRSQAKPSKKTR